MDIGQHTWVIVETLNEGEEGEKVTVRRVSFYDTAFDIIADDTRSSPGDVPSVLVEETTQS